MPALPTASGIARSLACRASSVLPRAESTSEAAERGTALHAYAESCVRGESYADVLDRVPAVWRATASALDVDAVLAEVGVDRTAFGVELHAEQAYAYDPTTGTARVLAGTAHRDYSDVGPQEYAGTADVVVIDDDASRVTVLDWKFGHADPGDAVDSEQLRALALYAVAAYGCESARVAIAHVSDDGRVTITRADLGESALLAAADTLRDLARTIAADLSAGAAPATPGDHCRYCPCALACPAQSGALATAAAQPDTIASLSTTADGRRRLLLLRDFARGAPALIDAALRAAIDRGDTSLPDGATLAVETSTRRRVGDADAIHAAVLARLGADAAEIAAPSERSATLTTVKAAAKLHAPARGAARAGDALLAELEADGLVTVSTSESIVARGAQ